MEGGLSRFRFGIVTVSDTRGPGTDASGPAIRDALSALGATEFETCIVRDEPDQISAVLRDLCETCHAVFTTGGTGFSPRDTTPEATLPLLDKRAHGLEALLLLRGIEQTEMACLSRGVCGLRGRTLVVNLPGSPAGARSGIESLAGVLEHLLEQANGGSAHN